MSDNNKLEKEQASLRLVVVCIVFLYVLFITNKESFSSEYSGLLTKYGIFYIIISIVLRLFAEYELLSAVVRRYSGMVLDITITTIFMYYLAEYGALLFSVYLWVAVGNGFRYGVRYLVFCVLLAISSFLYLSNVSTFWNKLEPMIVAGIVILTVVPAYVAVLLKRLTMEKERAETANREKTRFLANVSHEVRTPLNAIVGFSSMLDKIDDRVEQKRYIKHIKDASNSLMALVGGVLDFSRIESGHVQIKQEAVNLYELLYSVEGMFSIQAEEKGLEYKTNIDESLPIFISGDKYRLQQILVNLVGNAVKFTDNGAIIVHAGRMRSGDGDGRILFEISDTGVGISVEILPHIFDRFRQADDSVQRRHGGTGLGTAIAKHLVDLMHGEIGVESEPGKGSRFWFSIPLVETSQGEAGSRTIAGLQIKPGKDGSLAKILVADDSELNRHVMKDMLSQMGLQAAFSESGMQTLEKLQAHDYDMLILDVQMPGMSGFEVIEKYRAGLVAKTGIPIIIITGEATAEVQDDCERLGVDRLLLKPVDYDELRYTIASLLPEGDNAPDQD